jgi:hypothetical protein
MAKFADRSTITKTVLSLIKGDYTDADLKAAESSWWKNIRSTGGFGLTYAGSKAFAEAEIESQEFINGQSSHNSNLGLSLLLDSKMTVPYYFYSDQKLQKIKIYDGRISMLITLYEDINSYLKTIEKRKP